MLQTYRFWRGEMRYRTPLIAAASLILSGCADCGASGQAQKADPANIEVPSDTKPEEATETQAPEASPSAPETNAKPKSVSEIRKAPPKQMKVAPIQKCQAGGCDFECSMNTRCLLACAGGNCTQACEGDSSCTATCDGGGCTQHCRAAAGCTFTCKGGGCDQRCHPLSACSTSCRGGKCTGCRGPDCKLEP